MKTLRAADRQKGFALVITLALLALLVLSIYALSGLTRVGSQIATTGVYQVQARQNALLGLNSALSQLKQFAGPDTSLTGTADIVSTSKDINSRWTGVWLSGDPTPRWLVSGEVDPAIYSPIISFSTDTNRKVLTADPNDIVLVNRGSINTLASRYSAGDGVVVPRVRIPAYDPAGATYTAGNYAFWVGDEGVKLSAALPGIGTLPAPVPSVHAVKELPNSWTPTADVLKAVSYEQLIYAGAGSTTIKNTFHCLTLVHVRYTDYPSRRAGMINVNSADARLWRGVFATFLQNNPGGSSLLFATAMSNRTVLWAPAGSDKVANGPFQTVAGFLVSNPQVTDAIVDVNKGGAALPLFQDVMQPLFTVRSDTFRIRAYGDALNPAPDTGQSMGKVEATAWCEAIVQRVKDSETGDGRFVITYFRWLGPDDI